MYGFYVFFCRLGSFICEERYVCRVSGRGIRYVQKIWIIDSRVDDISDPESRLVKIIPCLLGER